MQYLSSVKLTNQYWDNQYQRIKKHIPRLTKEKQEREFEKKNNCELNAYAEFYPSGVCRIVSSAGCPQGSTKIQDRDKTTYEFSSKSRNRFYKFMLSICPDNFDFYFSVVTIANRKHFDINLSNYKKAVKRILEKLSRYGIDSIGKTEFHKSGVPHLHLILIAPKDLTDVYNKILKNKIEVYQNEYNASDESKIYLMRSLLVTLWIDCLHLYFCNFYSAFNYRNYWACRFASVDCNIVKDYSKSCYYISKYTAKNKDYQNKIPKNYIGLRFTHKSLRNYKEKLFSEKIVIYKISDIMFLRLRSETLAAIKTDCLKKKKKYIGGYLNGFFYQNSGQFGRFCAGSISTADVFPTIKSSE